MIHTTLLLQSAQRSHPTAVFFAVYTRSTEGVKLVLPAAPLIHEIVRRAGQRC